MGSVWPKQKITEEEVSVTYLSSRPTSRGSLSITGPRPQANMGPCHDARSKKCDVDGRQRSCQLTKKTGLPETTSSSHNHSNNTITTIN